MRVFRKVAVSTFAATLMASTLMSAGAQEISDSHLKAAREAISAIEATARFDDILPAIAITIKQQLISNNPDLELQINDVVDEQTLALAARRADLENEAARAYAQAIAEEDLKAIATFYQSDAGQALLRSGPIVARETQQAAGVWRRGIERDLLEAVSAKLAEVAPRNKPTESTEGGEEPKAE